MSKVNFDSRCVGVGEMGIDLSGDFEKSLNDQTRVFKNLLHEYKSSLMYKYVLVIHCRDKPGSSKASDICLEVMRSKLPTKEKEKYKVHRHCFDGSLDEMKKWRDTFPNIMFGFTGLLLRGGRHPELEQVVQALPLTSILLETDSPYLQAPIHENHPFNTPYGIEEIAWRVATLKKVSTEEVPKVTSENAVKLYALQLST